MQHLPDTDAARSDGQRGRVVFGSSQLPVHQPLLFCRNSDDTRLDQ
jgi:hypothetical protein